MTLKHKFSWNFLRPLLFIIVAFGLIVSSCGVLKTSYEITKGTVKATYYTTKFITKCGVGVLKATYKIGEFTFDVLAAPYDWPMTNDLESIDGLSPQEAVRLGRVKRAPYTIKGKRYVPMTVAEAAHYRETGLASWYGDETLCQKGGHMTANGEVFDPDKPTAAHKYLPLPSHVRVTNLANGRSMILRVNDRGPFVKGRIIDLSAGAAKRLGIYQKGVGRVLVEQVTI